MYALMDCSNFFVSCERAFNPSLQNKPVAVLSSNDGCIIARSEEVKALGIPMGVPVFKVRDLIKKHQIHTYSSNFALYSDMSDRVLQVLKQLGLAYEPYSVDESFIHFPDTLSREELISQGLKIQAIMRKWLGLPVRIGLGPTKTLAKLANERAKERANGILHVDEIPSSTFHATHVDHVWGIGRRTAKTFAFHHIHTIGQLLQAPESWIRQAFNVVMLRTVRELKGQPCVLLPDEDPRQKSFVVSRSFREPIDDLTQLKERIAVFATKAAEKLRHKNLFVREIGVFIRTNRFERDTYYSDYTSTFLPQHTHDTRQVVQAAHTCLLKIYQHGKSYKKAGIYLGETTKALRQDSLFTPSPSPKVTALMNAMDCINQKYGPMRVKFAACGVGLKKGISSMIKRDQLSPSYTTCWNDLLQVG